MGICYNTHIVNIVKYNGNNVTTVNYNGAEVWHKYTITATTNNVTARASNPTDIITGTATRLIFTADGTNYKVPSEMPIITGATGQYYRASDTECWITISNPTSNVSFTVEGVTARITDLTGTNWLMNTTISSSYATDTSYNLTGNATGIESGTYAYDFPISGIKTSYWSSIGYYAIHTRYGYSMEAMYHFGRNCWIQNCSVPATDPVLTNLVLHITGGSDVTNTALINWFYANATLQS